MLNTASSSKLATSAYRSREDPNTHSKKSNAPVGMCKKAMEGSLWLGFDDGEKLRSSSILTNLVIEYDCVCVCVSTNQQ